MPVYEITSPDGKTYEVTAPDGASHDEVLAYAQHHYHTTSSHQEKPSSLIDAARSIPGGLAKGVSAIAGFPGDVLDMTNRLQNKYLDVPLTRALSGDAAADKMAKIGAHVQPILPTSDKISSTISRPTGGYYEPTTAAGKYAETIASFLPSAVGGVAGVGGRLARAAISGAASEGAGQATEGTPLEPYARVAGALAGGLAPPVAKTGIRSLNAAAINKGGQGFLKPDTNIALSKVRAAVDRDGGIASIQAGINNYATTGIANPALIDVSGNNVRRLVRAAASGEGPGQNAAISYADRLRANFQPSVLNRTAQLTPQTTGTAEQFAGDLAKKQQGLAATQYAKPYSEPITLTPEAMSALQGPDGRAAIQRAFRGAQANQNHEQMAELQTLLKADAGTAPEISAGALDRVRIAMGERAGLAVRQQNANDIARGLMGRKAGIDTALDTAPGLKEARGTYRGLQAEIDAVPVGQSALRTPSDTYSAQISKLAAISPNARDAAAVGHRQALMDALERPSGGFTSAAKNIATSTQDTNNLAHSFGKGISENYQGGLRNEISRVENANFISPNSGSQTALRLGESDLLSGIPLSKYEFVAKVIDKFRAGFTLTPAERAEIVRLGTTEANLRALSAKVSPRTLGTLRAGASAQISTSSGAHQ